MSVDVPKIAKDSRGRTLHIIEMDPGDQLDLFEACGAENSSNPAWTGMALLVCSVVKIDEKPLMMPRNPVEVKARARELGKHGIATVGLVLKAGAEAETAAQVKELAKN